MLILCDSKMPGTAREKLATFGEVVEFATEGITYEAISGHPDIFFCPTPAGLIVAPNLPGEYFKILDHNGISYTTGNLPVGKKYPESARYNALFAFGKLVHNPDISDPVIQKLNPEVEIIRIKQGYTRCSLIPLPNHTFITSDRGIEKTLKQNHFEVLFVDPSSIKLEGFEHGFIGGACGRLDNSLFICGSLKYVKGKDLFEEFTARAGIQVIELYDGPPMDIGTLIFLQN
jgi:hypothetical protein